jgi:dienelactone hydrolase
MPLSRQSLLYILPLTGLLALSPAAQGQTGLRKEVHVSAPTRLDWQFAASAFGKDAARLPKDYDSHKQRYLLFVPKSYKAGKTWPLVVFISPGDAPGGWPQWRKVCEQHGVFFCAPYAAGNSCPVGRRVRIVLDALDDVRRQYPIDPDRTYLAGFSGGGRMACTIGFSLPEYFGGIVPICGTNPPPALTYLRHRLQDRLSVAFITGASDFNRKENEVYMTPFLKALGVRDKLWVVPGMGHGVPGSNVLGPVYEWLAEDLPRRRADAKAYPGLAVSAKDTPTGEQQAKRLLETAEADLKQPSRVWRGVALLQGVRARWPGKAAAQAARRLQEIQNNDKLLERIGEQGGADERRFLLAEAKGLERFGQKAKALEAWQLLLKLHPDSPEGRQAAEAVRRLQGKSSDVRPPRSQWGNALRYALAMRKMATIIRAA